MTTSLDLHIALATDVAYLKWDWFLGSVNAWSIGVNPEIGVSDHFYLGNGFRWNNATIPKGVIITAAHLHIQAAGNWAGDTSNCRIIGDKEADAAAWSTAVDFQNRRGTDIGGADNTKRTAAQRDWNALPHWVNLTFYDSPDISAVIQEIINQGGWASGQHIVLFWDDYNGRSSNYAFRSCQGNGSGSAATLHIEYALPSAGGGIAARLRAEGLI